MPKLYAYIECEVKIDFSYHLQEMLRRKKSRLKNEESVNIIKMTANGKIVNGSILSKVKVAPASHRHLGEYRGRIKSVSWEYS